MGIAELRAESKTASESTAALLRELVAHLGENRTQLREEWIRRITIPLRAGAPAERK